VVKTLRIGFLLFLTLNIHTFSLSQSKYRPVNFKLPTRWTKDVSAVNALNEYPRPQMKRKNWTNLNGLWNYLITDKDAAKPSYFTEKILVPYPIESSLSGVHKVLKPTENLWYQRTFYIKPSLGSRILLHLGAVDNEATIFINGKEADKHNGGYTEFTIDITSMVKSGDNNIIIKVFDPTDQGIWPHGKQVSNPQNIYYTPSSGIWQTVWLEQVPSNYIWNLQFTPDIDKERLNINVNAPSEFTVEITALDGQIKAGSITGITNTMLKLPVKNPKLWSPDHPFLYDLHVKLLSNGKIIDEVTSYFGMRKVSIGQDEKGFYRIFLNNKYLYNLGTLDQGFWPDGLYTAPTDDALKFDIQTIKAMGFNTIRKHIKVEPARWYYHADKLGMLVWQDFVNPNQSLPEGSKAAFEKQLNETMEQLHNHPCITTWVLFNERWGRYDQQRLTEYVKQKDPSRLVNAHSGELLWVNEKLRDTANNPWISSEIADIHSYPDPMNAPPKEGRVQILGEFGGIGVFIPNHQWLNNKSWGYVQVTPSQLLGKYMLMNEHLQLLERKGLAGSIYTQPFDVEGEENGIMTYDREVIKMPFQELRKIHSHLNQTMGKLPKVTALNADLTDPTIIYSRLLQQYIDGKKDRTLLVKLTEMVPQFTTSTNSPGFIVMKENEELFKKKMGERQFTVAMMNMIYNGEMKTLIDNNPNPDWENIAKKIKPYGTPAEEIFLRAKVIFHFNTEAWKDFVPEAKKYLEKYGKYIGDDEKNVFNNAIRQHNL
jgi:hypothetical protein